ncbi:hypothetical protein G647_00682 [Cladophialophora carrionii CBS 160.54]|uniref:glutathione transferase n=1 Tax=Cladophialophora carrionii CBS 160.54 TaxID=1279043 RepID=V9DPI7_9EURO|nr:uncharacterized protein G647_00682 [Cladophialophora carrionii CBS 160.54]ETI28233.1 hypothetical protein G647_00682 [Cladophialophora carrionii CBS 160.54]
MPLKLYASPLSWNCLRPELVLAEKGATDVVRIPADLIRGTHKTAGFVEKSLFGKVPLLEDDSVGGIGDGAAGLVLFESRAISRYLCEKYAGVGPRLIPPFAGEGQDSDHDRTRALASRAIWEMRLAVEPIEFDVHVTPVISEMIIAPALGKPSDEAVLARHRPKLDNCLDVLDKALATMPFMGGEEFSLVDIVYMPCICVGSKCVDVFSGRPNLAHWWERVSAREGWKKAVKPMDEAWERVVPGWKGQSAGLAGDGKGGDGDNRAHL